MKVSEKSLELNIGAEVLDLLRNRLGMRKAYLRGLTQAEEKQEGVDFFAQLSNSARIFAFQFKAPRGRVEASPYRYTLVREQHDALYQLAYCNRDSVFYVFPFYVTTIKLQQDVPCLGQDSWLLDIANVPTQVFGNNSTKVICCQTGTATINPEYELRKLSTDGNWKMHGVSATEFAKWYEHYRGKHQRSEGQKNPWLVRGLRLAIVEQSRDRT